MRKLFAGLTMMFVAANAAALEIKELLSTIAMPLAVAAVSQVAGVPQTQLSNLVTTLNQANVPPAQFVEVIRYVPVALVDNNGQAFVTYVQDQAGQGVTGDALVNAIVQRLQSNYNVTPQLNVTTPATSFVVQNDYVPDVVLTRLGTTSSDTLTLIALPLAVAAVADIAGVPQNVLADFIASLNTANLPPAQMIEVVRYVPVALVDEGQLFVQFVRQQASQGVTGPALVPVIVRRLQPYYPSTQINVTAPAIVTAPRQVVVVDQNYVLPVVVKRVAEVRQHPHDGPPGQIKKQLGLQTGAEVVHGERNQPMISSAPAPAPRIKERDKGHGHARGHQKTVVVAPAAPPAVVVTRPQVAPAPQAAPAQGNGHGPGGAGPPGQQKEHSKGKDKGKDKG